jgi:synaptic vesicle membrane protein VAT-1
MKQIYITGHGGADKLQLRESPDPLPKGGELRIRVRASGVNFADLLARKGLYPDAPKLPCVVGYEVSARSTPPARASTAAGRGGRCSA